MKTKKVWFWIMGIICLGIGSAIGIVLGMQKGEQTAMVDLEEIAIKESPTNKIEHASETNTSLKQAKEKKDPNEAFKYTKEELTEENEKQKLEYEREWEQSRIESNKITKRQ